MASYQGHITFSSILGAAYGSLGIACWGSDAWGTAFLGAGLTAIGGMMPDLDSNSGRPLRELSTFAAAMVPGLFLTRLREDFPDPDKQLVLMAGIYLFVRYAVSGFFKHWTVHRGMFHSIPMMFIFGLLIFLLYQEQVLILRVYVAGGMMLGFFSHLLLDELYAVDLMGARIRLNKYAGSALKWASKSTVATFTTYFFFILLGYLAWLDH